MITFINPRASTAMLVGVLMALGSCGRSSSPGGEDASDTTDINEGIPADTNVDDIREVDDVEWIEDVVDVDNSEDAIDSEEDIAADTPSEDSIDPDDTVGETDGETGGVVGEPCDSMDECLGIPGGEIICFTWFGTYTNGYCSAICTENDECGPNGYCNLFPGTEEGYCYKTCIDDSDCRQSEGYSCDYLDPGVLGCIHT